MEIFIHRAVGLHHSWPHAYVNDSCGYCHEPFLDGDELIDPNVGDALLIVWHRSCYERWQERRQQLLAQRVPCERARTEGIGETPSSVIPASGDTWQRIYRCPHCDEHHVEPAPELDGLRLEDAVPVYGLPHLDRGWQN